MERAGREGDWGGLPTPEAGCKIAFPPVCTASKAAGGMNLLRRSGTKIIRETDWGAVNPGEPARRQPAPSGFLRYTARRKQHPRFLAIPAFQRKHGDYFCSSVGTAAGEMIAEHVTHRDQPRDEGFPFGMMGNYTARGMKL